MHKALSQTSTPATAKQDTMAQRIIELSCERFRGEISDEDDKSIRTASLDDVRASIRQIETQLAARQSLKNLNRLVPFLDAIELYSKAVDPLCNGVPFLPYVWAPVKFILAAVYEHTQTLDKILSAYAQIASSLPRMTRLRDTFLEDRDFQMLFGYLYEDIVEFHRKAYALIRKPAWKIFFSSSWGRFEHRFGDLIQSITKVGALIDKEAASLDIQYANQWRCKALEDSVVREQRWESEQAQALTRWLDTGGNDQGLKFEWLKDRCCEGTGHWILQNGKFRSWLQKGRGDPILWLYGKPGSGKSSLASQIISFLREKRDTRVLFFFCDDHSAPHAITARIFAAFVAQVMQIAPEMIPFLYDEYLAKGRQPSVSVLRGILAEIFREFEDIRVLVDGIDELPAGEHRTLIKELKQLTKASNDTCRLLISSQDLPSIRPLLPKRGALFLGDEKGAVVKDVEIIVRNALDDLNESVGIAIPTPLMEELRGKIVEKSEGMLLWVRLVLSLLESSANLAELRSNVDSLPKDLQAVYEKILTNIQDRCSPSNLARVRRIFGWLIFSNESHAILKHEVLIGTSLYQGSDNLRRDNRPFTTALEICKPLIEDGPRGTVSIIHSTVTQYLLSSFSGPFISRLAADQNIAFACISHLIQILDYVNDDVPRADLMTRTGLGIFGLQSYANEHWVHHFLQTFQGNETTSSVAQDSVIKQAWRLCEKHSSLLSPSNMTPPRGSQEDRSSGSSLRLEALDSMPKIQQLIRQVIAFREALQSAQTRTGLDAIALELDTTLFSRADAALQEDAQHLSRITSYQGLSHEDLLAFRSDCGQTAFTCPIRTCARFRAGYGSAAGLENHKATQHAPPLRCYRDDCAYNDVGFASLKRLREHEKNHQGERELPSVQTSFKRRGQTRQRRAVGSDNRPQNAQETREPEMYPITLSGPNSKPILGESLVPAPDVFTGLTQSYPFVPRSPTLGNLPASAVTPTVPGFANVLKRDMTTGGVFSDELYSPNFATTSTPRYRAPSRERRDITHNNILGRFRSPADTIGDDMLRSLRAPRDPMAFSEVVGGVMFGDPRDSEEPNHGDFIFGGPRDSEEPNHGD